MAKRMFKYFCRIWEKLDNEGENTVGLVSSVIYTYRETGGQDEKFESPKGLSCKPFLTYEFKTVKVLTEDISEMNDGSPLRLVFEIAKKYLEVENRGDKEISKAKIELYDKILKLPESVDNEPVTPEQVDSLKKFLEYLLLIQDNKIDKETNNIINSKREVFEDMTIKEMHEDYLIRQGKRAGLIEGDLNLIKVLLEMGISGIDIITSKMKVMSREEVEEEVKNQLANNTKPSIDEQYQ